MVTLFEISTDRVILRWEGELMPRGVSVAAASATSSGGSSSPIESTSASAVTSLVSSPSPSASSSQTAAHDQTDQGHALVGTLRVVPRNAAVLPEVAPYGYPAYTVRSSSFVQEGPALFEDASYHVILHPVKPARVKLISRDPGVITSSSVGPSGDRLSVVNFRGQVGYSLFEVWVDGVPEFDVEVEVFPTKIDYKSDYDAMLAELTDFFTGLALEYLRATYRLGKSVRVPQPSHIEWLTILRQVIGQLEQALRRIARYPSRRLIRSPELTRVEKLRRVDGAMRRTILRGKGKGGYIRLPVPGDVAYVREYVGAQTAIESLDTPEHRWLKTQLEEIRSRVARLALEERRRLEALQQSKGKSKGRRSERIVAELEEIEARITSLLRLEPLTEARGEPPANFSSLLLQASPGYREAYVTCLILRLGLRIEGGPFRLSVKDISALYEYWCYLAVVRLVACELRADLDPSDFLRVTPRGLRVELEAGKSKSLTLSGRGKAGAGSRMISLTYHPAFDSPTGRQLPDVGLSIAVEGWKETFELIMDAKYRLDTSPAYVGQHGTPGPPEDAVNVLHRYRDAILVSLAPGQPRDKRSVIMGVALFPFQDPSGEYERHTFFRSLDEVGIGALPFLPSRQDYVADFLRQLLFQSGWSLADRVLDHRAAIERARWMREAAQPALIAVIRPGVGQLEWIKENRLYYAPLPRLGKRKFSARWVALYQGRKDRGGQTGAVTHEAEVVAVDVKPRGAIKTPWAPSRPDELCVVYTLSEVREREHPIPIYHGMRWFRWASRLSLSRAREGSELYLETEPEWRLYDELKAKGITFCLRPDDPKVPDPDDPRGRAVFEVGTWRIRYAGAAGFRMVSGETTVYEPSVKRVIERIME